MSRPPTATVLDEMSARASLDPMAEPAAGLRSETIVLESRAFDLEADDAAPVTVKARLTLDNRVRASRMELTVFQEHYLMLRERRKGKPPRSALINLRYLDTRPALSRYVAKSALLAAVGSMLGALVAALLAYFHVLFAFSVVIAAGLTAAAAAALCLYAFRTTETITFRTAEGRVPALVLRANPGCIRACRALVPAVIRAIAEARRTGPLDRQAYLRREMREHYRLHETGVISADACSAGTRRILAKF